VNLTPEAHFDPPPVCHQSQLPGLDRRSRTAQGVWRGGLIAIARPKAGAVDPIALGACVDRAVTFVFQEARASPT
jgi:hypothetical protein